MIPARWRLLYAINPMAGLVDRLPRLRCSAGRRRPM